MGETMLKYLEIVAKAAGYGDPKHPAAVIGAIVSIILSFLGVIFVILIIYSGFLWMTAGGNEIKVMKAKKIIVNAVIGVFIVLASYSITFFVLQAITQAVG